MDASAVEIATALQNLLADEAARREARRFADVIAQLGGGETATRQVAELSRPRPAP